jgi:hypothetical protein
MNKKTDLMSTKRNAYDPQEKDEFVNQFEKLAQLLRSLYEYQQTKDQNSFPCVVTFFNENFNADHRRKIINSIDVIGFEKIRHAFDILNRECENLLCEEEDLFGIFKRHQFNKNEPVTDNQKIKLIGRYIHLTLIHLNILKKKKITNIPQSLINTRRNALEIINPLLMEIFKIITELQEKRNNRKIQNMSSAVTFMKGIFLNL